MDSSQIILQDLELRLFELHLGAKFTLSFKLTTHVTNSLTLKEALSEFSLPSRSQVMDLFRQKQKQGTVLLYGKPDARGMVTTTQVQWVYKPEQAVVVGAVRVTGEQQQSHDLFQEQSIGAIESEPFKISERSRLHRDHQFPILYASQGLADSRARLVQLNIALEGAGLGFWELNTTTGSLRVNRLYAHMLGYQTNQITGIDFFWDHVHPDDLKVVRKAFDDYKKGFVKSFKTQFRMRNAQGNYLHIESVGAYQKAVGRKGLPELHMVGIHRNRSDEVLRQEMLEEALEKAQSLSLAKSRFLGTVSHEIRTPVHGIQNLVQMASTYSAVPKQAEYLSAAQSTTRALCLALDSLVEYASLESTPKTLKQSRVDLRDLLGSFVKYFCPAAIEKGLSLHLEIDDRLAQNYLLDERKLGQVILGLIGNAIKYTDTGEVAVRLDLLCREHRPDQQGIEHDTLSLSVKDTGCGMNAAQRKSLFEPYVNHQAGLRESVGLGLGMSFVKICVDHMNASLNVRSEIDLGTTVEVEFSALGESEADVEQFGDEPGDLNTSTDLIREVLIVDDAEMNRLVLRVGLEHVGKKVFEAQSGYATLQMFREDNFRPDLIIMDIRMPKMDGIECTRTLRELYGSNIPIIGLTADATAETVNDCLAAGMNDVLFKPIDVVDLLEVVNTQKGAIHKMTNNGSL